MKNSSSIQYPKCSIHPSEYLQLVCQTCDHNCLACPLCVDSQHQIHQMISLKKFTQNQIPKIFAQKSGKPQQPNKQNIMFFINLLNKQYQESIQHMRKDIGHEINQLEYFFQEKGERLISQLDFICGNHGINNLAEYVQAVKLKIKRKMHLPQDQLIQTNVKNLSAMMENAINSSILEIRKIIFSLKELYTASSDILLNSSVAHKFHFSSNCKHPALKIQNQSSLIVNTDFDNSYHTCQIMPALSPFNPEIKLKIHKSQNKYLWVGISDKQSLKKSEYLNTFYTPGSNYWIWQAGGDEQSEFYSGKQVYTELKPTIGWSFQVGDIISIKILYEQNGSKKVKFSKNEHLKQQQFSYIEAIDQKTGHYYPCVGLGEKGQAIEIVTEQT